MTPGQMTISDMLDKLLRSATASVGTLGGQVVKGIYAELDRRWSALEQRITALEAKWHISDEDFAKASGMPPAPPKPDEGWTTLGELKPGDFFKTLGGCFGIRADDRGVGIQATKAPCAWGINGVDTPINMPVRRLTVLTGSDDEVEAVAGKLALVGNGVTEAERNWARRILSALRSLAARGSGR